MRMFVANATQQRVEFYYSVPNQPKRRQMSIPPLGQVVLADNLSQGDIDAVVAQHAKYGFVNAEDVSATRRQGAFSGLCFAIDKPVTPARIEALLRGNHRILDDRGRELRREAAVASNQEIVRALKSEQEDLQRTEINKVSLSVQHDLRDGDDVHKSDIISEEYIVDQNPAPQKKGRK